MEILKGHPCDARNYRRGRKGAIAYIVIHYVGALGSALANVQYYGSSRAGASAHLYVDHGPDAAVYESVALGDTAWHCGAKKYLHPKCRNESSIGIELCCHKTAAGKWYFDAETVAAGAQLTRELMAQYGIDGAHVLRHFDVTGKNCPAPFVEDAAAWEDFKKSLEETDMTKEEVLAILAEHEAATAANPASTYAKEAWDAATAAGTFDGTKPRAPLTREQAAVVLNRLAQGKEGAQ